MQKIHEYEMGEEEHVKPDQWRTSQGQESGVRTVTRRRISRKRRSVSILKIEEGVIWSCS